MGSLWGHLDEGVVFAVLGLWWFYNVFRDYIKAGGKGKFVPTISYISFIRGKEIPLEIALKIFCSVGGGLIEMFDEGTSFYDDEGNFSHKKLANLQHISIYCLFFTHSVLDLLRYTRVLYIEGLDYLTFAMSFLWYGLIFFFHTQYKSDPLETVVHTMGLLWCFGSGLSILWEYRSHDKFLPCYCKCLMVLSLGTWFIHTPFLLFSTDSFPGNNPNPRWDRESKENYQVAATLFGFHLCLNTVLSVILFAIQNFFMKSRGFKETIHFRRIPTKELEQLNENASLLSDEEL